MDPQAGIRIREGSVSGRSVQGWGLEKQKRVVFLTCDVESTALVGSHAGHTQVRKATGHLSQGQLNRVGAWLIQLGLIHDQRVDLSFLWGRGQGGRQLCGGRGPAGCFLDQGLNLGLPHPKCRILTTRPPGNSQPH